MSRASPPVPHRPQPAGIDNAWAPTEHVGSRAPSRRPAADPAALPVGTRLGEYTIEQVLGEGGFGIVYRAWDTSLERRVAIKEYMPASLAQRTADLQLTVVDEAQRAVYQAGLDGFVTEARMLAHFDHPALVNVHRFWKANGTAYMVMPFYQGTTLKQVLQQAPQPPDQAWLMSLLDALTDALAGVHAERCLHRDIAPDNILLLAHTGKPLLLDFGAARQVIGDATQRLTAILKPGYAPIEQYGEVATLRQGPWTDVYGLCAVVYAAVTGHKPPPAVGRAVHDTLVPLLQCAPADRYDERFRRAIDSGLRLRPDERLGSMKALRAALGLDVPTSGPTDIPLEVAATPTAQASGSQHVDLGLPDLASPASSHRRSAERRAKPPAADLPRGQAQPSSHASAKATSMPGDGRRTGARQEDPANHPERRAHRRAADGHAAAARVLRWLAIAAVVVVLLVTWRLAGVGKPTITAAGTQAQRFGDG